MDEYVAQHETFINKKKKKKEVTQCENSVTKADSLELSYYYLNVFTFLPVIAVSSWRCIMYVSLAAKSLLSETLVGCHLLL